MDTLDSRALHYIDVFAQKFSTLGLVRYRLTTAAGFCLPVGEDEDTFTIEVEGREEGKQQGRQHNVTIRQEGQRLIADPPHLKIEVGDIVLWHAPDPSTPGFTVRGEGASGTFDSSALNSEALYAHPFSTPGEYEWVDANGGRVSGVIHVQSLDPNNREECERWLAALAKGTLITIKGDEAVPDRVEIITGQTIFWAVENASGITITDARFVQRAS
jgi:plastocyanin